MTVTQTKGRNEDKDGKDQTKVAALTTTTTIDSVDLEIINEFCEHFEISQPTCSETCLGYIKDLGMHRFFLPPPERRLPGQQKSLAEIIAWISEDELSCSLPRISMAQLASSLAVAVLQYHSTPWLPETWQSSDVRFFGIGDLADDRDDISFTSPYLKVELLKSSKGKGIALGPVAIARNELLFRFGIGLLELGYSQPWARLKTRALKNLTPAKHTDYQEAGPGAFPPQPHGAAVPSHHPQVLGLRLWAGRE